jgi:hypothetical protein
MDFLAMLQRTGFVDGQHLGDTGYNSSPKTKGALVRARKPADGSRQAMASEGCSGDGTPQPADGDGAKGLSGVEDVVWRAIALGAQKAKLIDADSIVVEKWVTWKCIYGCSMFGHDGHHPPQTPDVAEAREVIGEYDRAILLNGPDGRRLSEVACRLEAEAYHAGFYKALALIALPVGGEAPAVRPADQPGAT